MERKRERKIFLTLPRELLTFPSFFLSRSSEVVGSKNLCKHIENVFFFLETISQSAFKSFIMLWRNVQRAFRIQLHVVLLFCGDICYHWVFILFHFHALKSSDGKAKQSRPGCIILNSKGRWRRWRKGRKKEEKSIKTKKAGNCFLHSKIPWWAVRQVNLIHPTSSLLSCLPRFHYS